MTTPLTHVPMQAPAQPTPINLANEDDRHVRGYPKLAFFFSECPNLLHVRRFSALAVRLLLFRQHHLTELENTLLNLENIDAQSSSSDGEAFTRNYRVPETIPSASHIHGSTQRGLYELLKNELKEYEEAIIRFNLLCSKGYDPASLAYVQWELDGQNGFNLPLSGVDAYIWGSLSDPDSHASDLIQVVDQASLSVIARLVQDRALKWAPTMPDFLWPVFFWRRKRQGSSRRYEFSRRSFEVVSALLGNILISLLVYAAVTSLYFSTGKVGSITAVIVIASVTTVCSVLFHNHQFTSMLATVCAVLVTLLLKDNPRPLESPQDPTY